METEARVVKFQTRLFVALEQWLDGQPTRDERRWQDLAVKLGYAQSTVSRYRTLSTPVTEGFVFAVAEKIPGMDWVVPEFVAAKFGDVKESEPLPRELIESTARSLEAIAEKAAEAARALRSQGAEAGSSPKKKTPRGKGPP